MDRLAKKRGEQHWLNARRRLKWRIDMMEKSINLGLEVNRLIFQHDFIC